MAEIPLLAREEEISLAKKIEITRKRFRQTVLGCRLAMVNTLGILSKVHRGLLPFDRTIKVSLDRTAHQGADPGANAAQPDHAQPSDGAKPQRVRETHQPPSEPRPKRQRHARTVHPHPDGSAWCWSKNSACGRGECKRSPCSKWKNFPRAWIKSSREQIRELAGQSRQGRPKGRSAPRVPRPYAAHPRKPPQPEKTLPENGRPIPRLRSRQTPTFGRQPCGWLSRSPKNTEIAA